MINNAELSFLNCWVFTSFLTAAVLGKCFTLTPLPLPPGPNPRKKYESTIKMPIITKDTCTWDLTWSILIHILFCILLCLFKFLPQLKDFRKLRTCKCESECGTFRPVQPIGSRVVQFNNWKKSILNAWANATVCVKDCDFHNQNIDILFHFICKFSCLALFFTNRNLKKIKARSLETCLGLCEDWHGPIKPCTMARARATILGTLLCINDIFSIKGANLL